MMSDSKEAVKAIALAQLAERREWNAGEARIDNATLVAGSPMHYYCTACGDHMVIRQELHLCPVPQLCFQCQFLKSMGWLE